MRLFSYVVARDYGFAPNPFHGSCTLATCKPMIRKTAQVGDWIIGTGSKENGRDGYLVYAMQVAETMSFGEYWADPRFAPKRPDLGGSNKRAFGDNIYRQRRDGTWAQENSHHSLHDGTPNPENVSRDTRVDRMLIAYRFAYWGSAGPRIPKRFRDFDGYDVCVLGQGHKCRFPDELVREFLTWFDDLGKRGYLGRPQDW